MESLIATATTTFASTTGFSLQSVVDFAVDKIKLVLGTGLGVLDAVLPLVAALVAILIVVGLIGWGWKYFRTR